MSEIAEVRTEALLDGAHYVLAQDIDLDDLRRRVLDGVSGSGSFVDLDLENGRSVSVLISARTHIVLVTGRVVVDAADIVVSLPEHRDWDLL